MKKTKMDLVIEETRQILKEYRLCDYCLGRMFASKLRLVSHKNLGEKIRKITKQSKPKSCYLCKNLMPELDTFLKKILDMSKEYEFSTFLIGAILKPSILDRDDIVRSKFKLRGIAGIKSDVTREMGKQFGKKTRTKVDYQSPDIVFTIDFKKDQCDIKPKALFLQGRYTKEERGIPQKQTSCNRCDGKGCFVCDFHGISEFNSVEGYIAKFLFEKFGAQQAKITWIGSEDQSSLVLGNGRPFFVKMINPHKRKVTIPKKVKIGNVSILNLRTVSKIPTDQIKFKTDVVLEITAEKDLAPDALDVLGGLKEMPITISENVPWKNQKKIYDIKVKKLDTKSFTVLMTLDGGIPLKRLVTGNNVEPSISMLLENACKCTTFDFHKIVSSN
ncbi:MAG: tRNA pseudouridine(54/55) synthase Pus10 [Thaumarchaeota archaeon]|nr:tRNA pseudouridine(54/55) synthase Pus10 [Nitrososphaerota archaeon]MDE1817112.1 tRNA pseudouridine(54/55) synthase Pus10 [Nitrososphaerota archaeon]MDE1876149.1 tRNA pseudouridine(54/55) synthase Pus10 [Nitrososphaerota archaeon]